MIAYGKKLLTALIVTCALSFLMATTAAAATASSNAGTVFTASASLSVYAAASTSSTTVAMLPRGSTVTLISRAGRWWQVEYANGQIGWSNSASLRPIENSRAMRISTSSSELPVRNGTADQSRVITRLPRDMVVVELSRSNGKSKILYHGTNLGYVNSSQLAELPDSAPSAQAILLGVPGYKQYDGRWAKIKIGNEGDTMRDIGCTTTALAMTESYRTGTAISPAAMSSRLSYTPDGFLYWPDRYEPYFKRDYLKTVRTQLEAGRPVIIGAKNRAGGGHWVVITGHNGKQPLCAADFSIHDPDSVSRTNLAQFLFEYPDFYKIKIYNR